MASVIQSIILFVLSLNRWPCQKAWAAPVYTVDPASTPMLVVNHCGTALGLAWVNEQSGTRVPQSKQPLGPGSHQVVNTYTGHLFVMYELSPARGDGTVPFEALHRHTGAYETVIVERDVTSGEISARLVTPASTAQATAEAIAKSCNRDVECMTRAFEKTLAVVNEGRAMENRARGRLATRQRDEVCEAFAQGAEKPSRPLSRTQWLPPVEAPLQGNPPRTIEVDTYWNHSHASIQQLKGFITPEECSRVAELAEARGWSRATVAGDEGLQTVSQTRLAEQATIADRADEVVMQRLRRRLFAYVRDARMHGGPAEFYREVVDEGQDELNAIRYGFQVTHALDEYGEHCDGNCDGHMFVRRGRCATMIMYCQVPTDGSGATTFLEAGGLALLPQAGDAIFFRYVGPDGKTDTGFSKHSGCPVRRGQRKMIVTMWYRYGVSKELPATSFEPSGVPTKIAGGWRLGDGDTDSLRGFELAGAGFERSAPGRQHTEL